MANLEQPNNSQDSNEIDLGQLFELIKKGFHNLFKKFLRLFVYFKKNLLKLVILIAIGVGVGLLMNNLIPKKLKTEVIVKPNFNSKDYLYAAVDEIASNILAKDSMFFKNMGVAVNELDNFSIEIEPVEELEEDQEIIEQNTKYLEVLQNFKNDEFILNAIKSEIFQNSEPVHRITFYFKNGQIGNDYARKMMNYINSNPYFIELQKVSIKNAEMRIEQNKDLVNQIDDLIANYSKKLANNENVPSKAQGMLLLDSENSLNIPNLLSLKNRLIRETEDKRFAMLEQADFVSIQNFGKTQPVKKSLLGKNLVLFPSILLGAFFLLSMILYMNKKAKELL